MDSNEPTRQERREARRANGRKMGVTGRSVFLIQELGQRPAKHQKRKERKKS